MKTTSRWILAALFLATAFFSCFEASAYNQITRPYQSVRSSGMGGVRITTGLYEENFFGNPARSSYNPTWRVQIFDIMAEANSQLPDTVRGVSSGGGDTLSKVANTAGKNNHGRVQTTFPAFYWPNVGGGKWSYAFGIIQSTQFDLAIRKSYSVDPQVVADVGPAVTVSRKLLKDDSLAVGVTPHLTYRLATMQNFGLINLFQGQSLSPSKAGGEGAHLELDLGGTYILPYRYRDIEFQTGLAMNNLFGGFYKNVSIDLIKSVNNAPRKQPRSVNMGVAARKEKILFFNDNVLAFEITDIGNNAYGSVFRLIHLGGETKFLFLRPRLGINQGYLCAGLGFDLKILTLDLATYGEELTLSPGGKEDRRYSLRLGIQI